MNRQSYNPPGVCKNPIPIRLMADEQIEADQIAALAGISRAKVLREAIIAGLPIARKNLLGISESPASSGAIVTPIAAALSTLAA